MLTLAPASTLRSTLILATALVTACALACGGGGGSRAISRPTAPAAAAPKNVIAFGAQAGDGAFGMYLMQPDGAGLRKLSNEAGQISSPSWSPRGDRIAYVVSGAAATLRIYDFSTTSAKTLSEQVLIGDLGAPLSWSPDGNRLAFIENVGGGRLRIYDLGLSRLLNVVDVPAVAVDWSPVSDTLAIVRSGSSAQQSAIYTVKPDGSSAKRIVGGDSLNGDPRWSPDGTRLASWTALSALLTARALELRKSNGDTLSDVGPGLDPAWSKDGQLAYSRPASATAGTTFDIYVLPSSGGQPQLVSHASARDRGPSWSPAGDTFTYLAQADRNTAFICTATPATERQVCLFNLAQQNLLPTQPAWSPF